MDHYKSDGGGWVGDFQLAQILFPPLLVQEFFAGETLCKKCLDKYCFDNGGFRNIIENKY